MADNNIDNTTNVKIELPGEKDVAEETKRQLWGSKVECLLTLIGTAVGLGNIWRFPYLCFRHGGGAFLIPYLIGLVLIGYPTLFLELSIGQFSSLNLFSIWNMSPIFKGLGMCCFAVNFVIVTYYSIVVSWTSHYLFSSFRAELLWSSCGNWWNTNNCCDVPSNLTGSIVGKCSSPSEEYFFNRVLQISNSISYQGTLVWELVGCAALIWVVVFLILIKGISSLGKVAYFFTIFPYILLTVMLGRGVTLKGAKEGILFYVKPDFSKLADARSWSDAATQTFFSLSLCHGPMLSMASYSPFKNNIKRDSIAVAIINCLTSFYGGFAIFSVLGYMAENKKVPVSEVVDQGPGLIFVGYPEALSEMPVAPLWSILFFLMMITLGFSSLFTLTEVMNTLFLDNFPVLRKTKLRIILSRASTCLFLFLVDLIYLTNAGYYVLSLLDYYVASIPMLVCSLLEIVIVSHVYGFGRLSEDVEMMTGMKLNWYFRGTLFVITPVVLLALLVGSIVQFNPLELRGELLPQSSQIVGGVLVVLIVSTIPFWCTFYYCFNGGFRLLKKHTKPCETWGPMLAENRTGRYATNEGVSNEGFDNRLEESVDKIMKGKFETITTSF